VINTAQTNRGSLKKFKPLIRILTTVVIKLIAPSKDEIPARCKLKIAKSTEPPECETIPLKGG